MGAFDFARECDDWAVHVTEHGRNRFGPEWQRAADCDGIIARVETPATARRLRALNVPVVNVSSVGLVPECVSIVADCEAITRLAAEHLLEQGFTNFGFYGVQQFCWSERRRVSFAAHLERAGYDCASFSVRSRDIKHWNRERTALAEWLRELPKPVGIMSCFDLLGQQLLDVCHDVPVRVPEEVAVIGVNNDELFCELCDPPMSSVALNGRRAGYEAASVLHKIMDGREVPLGMRIIPPLGVVPRRSSDFIAVPDETVAAAVRFIRQHACDGITVEDVAATVKLSRSALERRCRKVLNSTIHEQIQRVRLGQVRTMLIETDLPLKTIAFQTGFEHPEYLTVAFKRHTGLNPSEFRRQVITRRS